MKLEDARKLANHDARHVVFEGTMNCRDLGGLPTVDGRTTRFGRVYRSSRLSNLMAGDTEPLAALGLQHIFDLRLPFERERYPNRVPLDPPPPEHHHGYLPAGAMDTFEALNAGTITVEGVMGALRDQYAAMATAHPEPHAALCRRLIAPGGTPLLLHCSGGKDRTGVAVAILLRFAGVAREIVIADYLLTNVAPAPLAVIGPTVTEDLAAAVGLAHVEFIESAMDAIEREFDGYEAYLQKSLGLSPAECAALGEVTGRNGFVRSGESTAG